MKHLFHIIPLCLVFLLAPAQAEESIATLRGDTPLNEISDPPRIAKPINDDIQEKRNYPMQPPLVPHNIRNYQVDLNTNKCVSCHSRRRTGESQAPMISVTHYMDRDGNFLAEVSPRRYFCLQCHVPQTNAPTRVGNDFTDMDELLIQEQP